jgi:acetyl esterase/lipase
MEGFVLRKTLAWRAAILMGAAVLAPAPIAAQDRDDAPSRYLPTPAVEYPGGVRSLRDVMFAELSGYRPLTLDLYLPPEGGTPKPVIVFVHGGAWVHRTGRDGGTFRDFPAALASFAARGYVVASVNYRFSKETHFPGPVQDVEMAIQWLRRRAATYNIDPARFVAWGSSAGGQIASLIGTGCDAPNLAPPMTKAPMTKAPMTKAPQPSHCVQGVIDWYGIIDLELHAADLGMDDKSGVNDQEDAYLGCVIRSTCPAGWARSASALAYIDPRDPPFLIQHGLADTSVSPKQAQRLHDALRAAGVPAELVLYPDVSHGFAKVAGGEPDDAVNGKALAKVSEFLDHYFPVTPTRPVKQ